LLRCGPRFLLTLLRLRALLLLLGLLGPLLLFLLSALLL
jgi:hypothetical protein